jgi:lysophospholipase L1-like esterase
VDRALHYREQIVHLEEGFYNEGLRLVDSRDIARPREKPVVACIGGSLFRYWHLPADGPVHFVNKGGVEEKTKTTLQRMEQTVLAVQADSVLINAGFCGIHTAVYSGGDIAATQRSIVQTTSEIVAKARKHGIEPVLTTLQPVRPRTVFPYTGWIEYDKEKKRRENEAIRTVNTMLRDFARSNDVRLIDFHAALVNDSGRLRKQLALQDGEHLNWRGYRELKEALSAELEARKSSKL